MWVFAQSVPSTNCSQVKTSMKTRFPVSISDSSCRNYLVIQTNHCSNCWTIRWSWRWKCWMWRSWVGAVTHSVQLWSWLDILPNSLKHLWKWLIVEKWTLNWKATALVDIPVVSMPSIHCQHILEAYMCNNHTVSIYNMPHLSPHTDGWSELNRFVNKIWEKYAFCLHKKSRWVQLMKNGSKNKCCIYIFAQSNTYFMTIRAKKYLK